jgi:hypothetical protein
VKKIMWNPSYLPIGPITFGHLREATLMVRNYRLKRYKADFEEAYRVAVVLYYGHKLHLGVIAAQAHKYRSAAVVKGIERFVAERSYIDSVRGEGTLAKMYIDIHKEFCR